MNNPIGDAATVLIDFRCVECLKEEIAPTSIRRADFASCLQFVRLPYNGLDLHYNDQYT